ncbi:MAG TPA: glycoside hydrolase family 38 C-terminal domain-containing protein [Bacteroidales bacterium]|nr:glycoside hydrolase family 38 C-terminal domain-containing protein [Bacteroidales bacterium]
MKADKDIKKEKTISRRHFMEITATGTAAMAIYPAGGIFPVPADRQTGWPADAPRFRFHMIGHAHIDPVWLWPWPEGVAVVHSTFRSALDRMKETPGLTFISSSAQFYQWVSENDPAMLEEIKTRVEEGRWNIVGGWWVEPDLNIPSGESLVRQGLYGQQTLKKLLGSQAKVAFNPDSFGHCGTLPQILSQQGMENYVFMRPAPHEKQLPANIFWWEGFDGSRVLTSRIMISYADDGRVGERVSRILAMAEKEPVRSVMAFYGDGDHGGGASKENIRSIEELKSEPGAPVVFYSTPERYFNEIRKSHPDNLPVVKDDLQHHARGCYTAGSDIKKGNCQSEIALILAEKISAIGSDEWGFHYPMEELTAAWKRVLFLQFHDSIAGTSLYEHFQTAREGFGFALDSAYKTAYMALQKLEWSIPAEDPDSEYLVAFNPHAWDTKSIIEYDLDHDDAMPTVATDEKGNQLLHQWTAGSTETGSRRKVIACVSLPSMGYRQVRFRKASGGVAGGSVKAEGNSLENEFLKLIISNDGTINIFDKETGKDIFAGKGGCRGVVLDDPSDTWSHDVMTFDKVAGRFGECKIRITEKGPLRATIRSLTRYNDSALTIDWMVYSGSRSVEAHVSLDWKEHLKMFKFSFPVDVDSPVATYETPYGYIERKVNGEEEPGQRWIDISGNRGDAKYGLAVINDAKYGYSVSGNDMNITVARSAVYAHHRPRTLDMDAEHLWMDQGLQSFRMLIVPHKGDWRMDNIPRVSEEFNSRPMVIYQGIHGGSRAKSGSFISVDTENIRITAIKKAETGNDIIVRCVESFGLPVSANLKFWFSDKPMPVNFRGGEIKSFRTDLKTKETREVNLLED